MKTHANEIVGWPPFANSAKYRGFTEELSCNSVRTKLQLSCGLAVWELTGTELKISYN